MSLFTNPVVLDTDHTFSYVGQEFDTRASVGVYTEDAAAISAESVLRVKHDNKGIVPRHLLQRSVNRVPSADTDAGLKRITINFTITADPLFSSTEVQEEVDILIDATGEANFVKSMLLSKP